MRKFEAGALAYVVGISLVFSMIISAILLINNYVEQQFIINRNKITLRENVNSAYELIKARPDLLTHHSMEMDLYGQGTDSVSIKIKPWGFLYQAEVSAKRGHFSTTRSSFIAPETLSTSLLYLPESQFPLTLTGTSQLVGRAEVPQGIINTGTIGATSFSGQMPSPSDILRSNSSLPEIASDLISHLRNLSIGNGKSSIQGDKINSFKNGTIKYSENSKIIIDEQLKGNILVKSEKSIEVNLGAQLEDIILMAPKIIIHDFVSGSFQAIASDTLLVGSGVKMQYPSFLCVFGENKNYIAVNSASIEGAVFSFNYSNPDDNLLRLGDGSVIHGAVYSNGYLELGGNIYGYVMANKLSFNQFGIIRENTMYNTSIKPLRLKPPSLLASRDRINIIKWLE